LEDWCAARQIADPAVIRARSLPVSKPPSSRAARRQLAIARGEPLAMRNVHLSCGKTVLSVAWNWYVPARLTPTINETLRSTDTPFGKVVAPLRFRREPLATTVGAAEDCPARTISTHRARLLLPDGSPFAYLIECYTAANLANGEP
jgi:chorismate-pyruvate lyase